MASIIYESGMAFIVDNAFQIEKSMIYKGLGEGVKSVEFIRVVDDSLLFVLVIKKHEHGWCKPVKFELERTLPSYFTKIWKPNILVINQEILMQHYQCSQQLPLPCSAGLQHGLKHV